MHRVLPSQVVALIDRVFPWAEKGSLPNSLESTHAPTIGAIIALADEIPDELFSGLIAGDHTLYVAALATLRTSLKMWEVPVHSGLQHRLVTRPELDNRDPVSVVRSVLNTCPDEAPSRTTADFTFLGDSDLATTLRLDTSTAFSTLANGEFKAASVMAGSVIEALLLWAIRKKPSTDWQMAWATWERQRKAVGMASPKALDPNPLRWDLEQLVEVARHISVMDDATATGALLAKDFRNLIHPGRAERLQRKPTLGSATIAVGAMQTVIDELRNRVAATQL